MILIILLLSDTITLLVKGDFMFIDEKIKEFVEYEKKDLKESKEILRKIREEIKIYKELNKYKSTYSNDLVHQELEKDFNKVLDNIESLANTFDFKTGIEISMLCFVLIHGGYLTKDEYCYNKKIFDIETFSNDKSLKYALKVFSGVGCCRHTAAFLKEVLDRFNINNSMAPVDTSIEDFNICEIRLFLHNIHKKFTVHNHIINHINEWCCDYFLDITSKQLKMFESYNGYVSSIDGYDLVFPLYSYSSSSWNNEFTDYRKIPRLTKGEADELIDKANKTIKICDANEDLLMKFYLQNIVNFQRINENYNKVYEKEKSLRLIKCDK